MRFRAVNGRARRCSDLSIVSVYLNNEKKEANFFAYLVFLFNLFSDESSGSNSNWRWLEKMCEAFEVVLMWMLKISGLGSNYRMKRTSSSPKETIGHENSENDTNSNFFFFELKLYVRVGVNKNINKK